MRYVISWTLHEGDRFIFGRDIFRGTMAEAMLEFRLKYGWLADVEKVRIVF